MAHLVFGLTRQSHDMYRSGNRIGLLRDSDAILQTVKTRLLLHYEEWFLDLAAGLPWFTEMLTYDPDFGLIENRVAETVLQTDGVVNLLSISLSFLAESRDLGIDFSYTDVYGKNTSESLQVNI